jgi:hypothetical protein
VAETGQRSTNDCNRRHEEGNKAAADEDFGPMD